MYKIVLAFCLVLVSAKGEVQQLDTNKNAGYSHEYRPDDYLSLYRHHYTKNIQAYDAKLENFRAHYAGRAEEINVYLDLLTNYIVQLEDRLRPLEILNDYSKYCVIQNRDSIPDVLNVQNEMGGCYAKALDQLDTLCNSPLDTRNDLQHYYSETFEGSLDTCAEKSETEQIFIKCVTDAIEKSNAYTAENQKEFQYRLEAAQCSANANIKTAFDCSYAHQSNVTANIATADLSIRDCISRKHECKPCQYSCVAALELTQKDALSTAVVNPFFTRTDTLDCFILTVQQNDQYNTVQLNNEYTTVQQNNHYETAQQNNQYEAVQKSNQYDTVHQDDIYDLNPIKQ